MQALRGFVAGALSVVTVMAAMWWSLRALGYIPADANPLWSWTPAVPPLGVPRVLNSAFWGGVWGAVLALTFGSLRGVGYWGAWTLAGAIAVAGTAIFIVPMIKGTPIVLTSQRFMVSGLLNGAFGLGAAIWLSLFNAPDKR